MLARRQPIKGGNEVSRSFVFAAAGNPLDVPSVVQRSIMSGILNDMAYHARTLYLFTCSDFKTIVLPVVSAGADSLAVRREPNVPQSAFALVAGPYTSMWNAARTLVWIWLHLLQCNTSNQYRSAEEDALNKPWRPLSSGRITLEATYRLRWWTTFACLALSASIDWHVVIPSLVLMITTVVYDEGGLAGHWIGKNFAGVFGYSSFETGASMVMSTCRALNG
jgi:hypothetical protein